MYVENSLNIRLTKKSANNKSINTGTDLSLSVNFLSKFIVISSRAEPFFGSLLLLMYFSWKKCLTYFTHRYLKKTKNAVIKNTFKMLLNLHSKKQEL